VRKALVYALSVLMARRHKVMDAADAGATLVSGPYTSFGILGLGFRV